MEKIEEFIKQTAEEIRVVIDFKLMHSHPEKLYEAVRYLPMLNGKRLRPIMCMLVAGSLNGNIEMAREFGVVLELVHNFTLIHDDIMDDDDKRRGQPTIHVKYDQNTAINAGDALFARSFEILANMELPPEIVVRLLKEVAEMARRIVEGQQLDIGFENRTDVTQAEYLEMIRLKTSKMYQIAAKGGAIISGGQPEISDKMANFGQTVGIGFQIWDDVLDIIGNENKLGKPVGSDLLKGKSTILIIHARNHGSSEQLHSLEKVFRNKNASQDDVKKAVKGLEEIGSIDFAKNMASQFAEEAKQILESTLPDSEYKNLLYELVDFMVLREK